AGHWRKLKQEQQNKLREILDGFSAAGPCKQSFHRTVVYNGYQVEHWTFEPEHGILVPAALCLPSGVAAGEKRPAVLVADEGGKQAAFERGLVDALVNK